jgi:hypothetical protein
MTRTNNKGPGRPFQYWSIKNGLCSSYTSMATADFCF